MDMCSTLKASAGLDPNWSQPANLGSTSLLPPNSASAWGDSQLIYPTGLVPLPSLAPKGPPAPPPSAGTSSQMRYTNPERLLSLGAQYGHSTQAQGKQKMSQLDKKPMDSLASTGFGVGCAGWSGAGPKWIRAA